MTAKVYVPQETRRRNEQGDFEPVHDLSPALQFGDIEVLYPSMPAGVDGGAIIKVMRDKLRDFSDRDFIVATGDPAIIAAAVMVAASLNFQRVKLLKWDRRRLEYMVIQLDAR